MTDSSLGRLEPVDIETVWDSEPAGFTPWLAQPDNLRILGDVLGLRLEFEAREKAIGPFRADRVCRERGAAGSRAISATPTRTTNPTGPGSTNGSSGGSTTCTASSPTASRRCERRLPALRYAAARLLRVRAGQNFPHPE